MSLLRLPDSFRLLLRAILGLGATAAAVFGYSALLTLAVQAGQPLSGTWEGAAYEGSVRVPLRLELRGRGDQVEGAFFDGHERLTSTAGRVEGGTVTLEFAPRSTRLVATLRDGKLHGTYAGAAEVDKAVELQPRRGVLLRATLPGNPRG